MTKFIAVVMTVEDQEPPGPAFTEMWLTDAGTRVAEFWRDMSGGRETVEWAVHPGVQLRMSQEAKNKLSAAQLLAAIRDQAAVDGNPIAADQHLIAILNDQDSHSGVTETDPLVANQDLTVALVCHEMGHFYQHQNAQPGAHANAFTPAHQFLPVQYEDPTCMMGAEGGKYSFHDPALTLPGHSPLDDAGPALCPPMTTLAGWLDQQNPQAVVDVTNRLPVDLQLAKWGGAPPPVYGGPAVVIIGDGLAPEGDRIFLSLRSPSSRWDAGFPSAPGTIVAQEQLSSGASLLLNTCPSLTGAWMRLGRATVRVDVLDGSPETTVLRVAHDPWRNWTPLPGPELHRAARVAAVARTGMIDAFVVGRDGLVHTLQYRTGMWTEWQTLQGAGFSPTAGIAAATTAPGSVDLFVMGLDGQIRHRHFDDGTWNPGWPIIDVGNLGPDSWLAATATDPDTIQLFGSDLDGRVIHATIKAGARTTSWEPVGDLPSPAAAIAAETLGDQAFQVHALTTGPDGRLWTINCRNGRFDPAWMPHGSVPVPSTVGIAAVSRRPGNAEVVAAGDPMAVRTVRTGSWLEPTGFVDGLEMSDTSTLAAVSRDPSSFEVLAVGADRQLHVIACSADPNFQPADRKAQRSYKAALITSGERFVSALPNGQMVADRYVLGPWETFTVTELQDVSDHGIVKTLVAIQSHTGRYVSAQQTGMLAGWLLADRSEPKSWELFKMFSVPAYPTTKVLQALDGHLWCAENGGGSVVSCNRINIGAWEQFSIVEQE